MKKDKSNKTRRIMAIMGLIVIALLYIYFFILALRKDPNMSLALFAAFAATISVPVLLYVFGLLLKNIKDYSEDPYDDDENNEGKKSS